MTRQFSASLTQPLGRSSESDLSLQTCLRQTQEVTIIP
jgi:hypothetical protein